MSLSDKLDKIRASPRLQNQQQTALVLSAVEDTLRDQKTDFTPTAYFAALLSLLSQYVSPTKNIVNKEIAYAVVYLLDLITPHVPEPLLRSKFSQVLVSLAPTLTHPEVEAPLLRASIGCIESLLLAQDSQAWAQSQSQVSPRRATAGLLAIAADHRPKVRKRAQDALANVLKHPPPSPSVDHPAADLCAETALQRLKDSADAAGRSKKQRSAQKGQHQEPSLIHALQLVRAIASASGGWPARKLDALCEMLLSISRSSNEYLVMTAFEVFEIILAGLADEVASTKLPRLLEILLGLAPSQNDSQLLPPWIAVISRGYDVSAQVQPRETFQQLPVVFRNISNFLGSPSHNIRVSASECLISFLANCIPDNVILEPSTSDQETLQQLANIVTDLVSVRYQSAWMEVFILLAATFDAFKWQSWPLLSAVVSTVGDLRENDSFTGKAEADKVLQRAIRAMGPDKVLEILPLNLVNGVVGQRGRAWLLPLLRDSVFNAPLTHFRSELVPLSEKMYQKVIEHGDAEKTMEIKIYETLVQQAWSTFPGYCQLPSDVLDAFDQPFAEQISTLLYQQPELRTELCKGLENLVQSNRLIASAESNDNLMAQSRVSKAAATQNLQHLAGFAGNLLAVLFNVYSGTLPQSRGSILTCINAYLSIIPQKELIATFDRVVAALESSLTDEKPQDSKDKTTPAPSKEKMPPMSHTLMDLVITISIYLPRESFATLFNMAAAIVVKQGDPQLQKKAYKLIPRLSESETGREALRERNGDLQELLRKSADTTSTPARRDRLLSIAKVVEYLSSEDLHFIPSVLSEVVMAAKEVNEKARTAAFDLLVSMGEKMQQGGTVMNSKVAHMPDNAPAVPASLEEYFTMVAAGLVGSSPHMISASITAITRILYRFHNALSESAISDLVQTMDLFLTSSSREIVSSVLGFVKVSVISLPESVVVPRLESLVPNLMTWSHEHKGHFRSKVKHILERMIRRFGYDTLLKWCPEADRKIIASVRKLRERRKKKKDAAEGESVEDTSSHARKGGRRFESELDEAMYGSDKSDSAASSDLSDDEVLGKKRNKKGAKGQTYIIEDEDEPLDLLDKKALGHFSSTKPLKASGKGQLKSRPKTDLDGKMILGESSDDGAELMEFGPDGGLDDGTIEGGVNAYVAAIRGRDVAQRGQKGRLKFRQGGKHDEEDEMEVDVQNVPKPPSAKPQPGKTKGKAGIASGRKGLGVDKARGGRVVKAREREARRQKFGKKRT